jgi:hypothetical protein
MRVAVTGQITYFAIGFKSMFVLLLTTFATLASINFLTLSPPAMKTQCHCQCQTSQRLVRSSHTQYIEF